MISLLRGNILEISARFVVIDVNGIGYKVFVTDDTSHSIKINSEMTLWTHLAVRENSQDLYGFTTRKERDFFELLITVSGVGPKSALNILSLISSDTLGNAIRTGSIAHLVKVSGIGRKTAEKIVLELKDKLSSFAGDHGERMTAEMSSDADVIEALKALGYNTDEAREALKKVDKNTTDTGAKVKAALKMLG
ncbi:MAG: Holliday junction branch migration protein RuvA [Patescibacteria group bacterium]